MVNQKTFLKRVVLLCNRSVPREALAKWGYNHTMYYVYLLLLANGQYYAGYTTNLKQRYKRHLQNSTKTTARIKPEKLEFYAAFSSKIKAQEFEKYLKTSSGFAFRNKRLVAID